MPASAAPSLFEPIATVYRPQRVNVSTICRIATIATAQISSEYVPPPNTFPKVPSGGCPPGVATGVPLEMISDSPSNVNSVPSVATNELTPRTDTNTPLTTPITMHTSSAPITAGTSGRPSDVLNL